MITKEDAKLLDECMPPKWRDYILEDELADDVPTKEEMEKMHEQNIKDGLY